MQRFSSPYVMHLPLLYLEAIGSERCLFVSRELGCWQMVGLEEINAGDEGEAQPSNVVPLTTAATAGAHSSLVACIHEVSDRASIQQVVSEGA